jgi:hypothetical protein
VTNATIPHTTWALRQAGVASWAVIFLMARLSHACSHAVGRRRGFPAPARLCFANRKQPLISRTHRCAQRVQPHRCAGSCVPYHCASFSHPGTPLQRGCNQQSLRPPFLRQALPQHQTTQRLPLQNRSICIHEATGFAILQKGYLRPTVGLRLSIYPVKITPACHSIVNAILLQATLLPPSPSTEHPTRCHIKKDPSKQLPKALRAWYPWDCHKTLALRRRGYGMSL